jgi:hypothetical protein
MNDIRQIYPAVPDDLIEKRPGCGQQLRFPEDIGGVLVACPSCGNKFQSDFKLGGTRMNQRRFRAMAGGQPLSPPSFIAELNPGNETDEYSRKTGNI